MLNHIRLMKEYLRVGIMSAMEYRYSFFIQVISMMLNDTVWIFFWWIFFRGFNEVNGWRMKEILVLYAVMTFAYGLAGFFFGNRNRIAKNIAEGRLDFYLVLPKNPLLHLLISRSSWYDVGDLLFGLIMAVLVLQLKQWPLYLFLGINGALIIAAFGVLVGSLAFFIGNAEETARNLYMGLISLSSYPTSIFRGIVRGLLYTIIPAAFIAGVPVDLLRNFSWQWFIITIAFTIAFCALSSAVFYYGLRRYESGNMIAARF